MVCRGLCQILLHVGPGQVFVKMAPALPFLNEMALAGVCRIAKEFVACAPGLFSHDRDNLVCFRQEILPSFGQDITGSIDKEHGSISLFFCAGPGKGSCMYQQTLPPSSRTVLEILDIGGAMTHKDLVTKSHLAPRTVRYALKKLKERHLIIEKFNFRDARQIIYQNRPVTTSESQPAIV